MHRLDDNHLREKLDPKGIIKSIMDLPDQFTHAWDATRNLTLPSNYIQISNVVICGMGGSAIGAALLKTLFAKQERIPLTIVRDYTLPAYVDRHSLVIAVSHSGTTEETLSAFRQAADKSAKLIAITSGAELERVASRYKTPTLKIEYESPPRAALGYLFVPLLGIFAKIGLLDLTGEEVNRVVHSMEGLREKLDPTIPYSQNPAKKLAEKMVDKLVIVYSGEALSETARRWKNQINENAKQIAFTDILPELCHNTVVGFDYPRWQTKQLLTLLLPSKFDYPRNQLRMKVVQSLLARKHLQYEVVSLESTSQLEEVSLTILFGDFVSYYLAIMNGVNPTPIESINFLKQELAKHNS